MSKRPRGSVSLGSWLWSSLLMLTPLVVLLLAAWPEIGDTYKSMDPHPAGLRRAIVAFACIAFLCYVATGSLAASSDKDAEERRKALIAGLTHEKDSATADAENRPIQIRIAHPSPDFFSRLVEINFEYIESYYKQTRVQASRSFGLSAFAAVVSLLVTVAGIVLMYYERTARSAVATAVGGLTEVVSAVFFYLYNRTVLKMSDYHQKLVITQNAALALRISEGLPAEAKVEAQLQLIRELSHGINAYLTATSPSEVRPFRRPQRSSGRRSDGASG